MSPQRSMPRGKRWLQLLFATGALAIVGLLPASAVTASASSTTPANSFGQNMFGIAAGGAIQSEDSTTLARDLDAIQAAGSRWLRIDINWAVIQAGGASSYNWGPTDSVVQGAEQRGMSVLGVIAYTPSWARPAGTTARYGPNAQQYAAFAQTAAEHYAALGVHAYEIWNEENTQTFWNPKPDPAAYTQLLKAAYPAIKSVDPQATVLTGGPAPSYTDGTNYAPADWLQAIYANGGKGYFDAVGAHPYCFPAYPGDAQSWSAWYQMYGTSTSMRSVMIANGDSGKKIWATEFGAPTNGPAGSYVSEATQAQMITKAYSLWSSYDWAGPLFVYQGRDLGTSTSDINNFFGLLRYDFSEKPAYTAYQQASQSAAGTSTTTTTTTTTTPTTTTTTPTTTTTTPTTTTTTTTTTPAPPPKPKHKPHVFGRRRRRTRHHRTH